MSVTDRLITSDTLGPPSAPGGISRDGSFDSDSEFRDVRPNRVQVITMTAFSAGDEFVLSAVCNGQNFGNTIAFTHGTDAQASDIQTALRTLLGDNCVVAGTTNAGPYTVTFLASEYARHYPKLVVVSNTGCTAAITQSIAETSRDGAIGALGESHRVSESDTILKPTIGTITVTDGVDEVQTVTFSAGTDGGTYGYRLDRGAATVDLDWDASLVEIRTALAEVILSTDCPTVAFTTGAAVSTLDLDDIGAGDTFKLTYNAVESSVVTTYAATLTTNIQAIVDTFLGADEAVVAKVDSNTYTITKSRPGAFASTFTATTAVGFTPLGSGGYTAGGKITSAAADPVYTFTFENGRLAGTPIGAKFNFSASSALTDGGVSEPAVKATGTAGVLGSASAAYTENGAGDSVVAAAVNDTTGKSYGFVVDAGTPVVFSSLPPGAYHAVLRTVEDGRVSKADNKAFTVASA